MGRIKKVIKVKEPVRLRQRKLRDGSMSLYLDIYQKGVRKYEYLGLYLVPVKTPLDKQLNDNALALAEKIKAEHIIMVQNNGLGNWDDTKMASMPFLKWLENFYEKEANLSCSTIEGRKKVRNKLTEYLKSINREGVAVKDINADICRGFLRHLMNCCNHYKEEDDVKLSKFSIHSYQAVFSGALNRALRMELIETNPMNKLERTEKVEKPDSEREFLTIEELKRLIATDCAREQVKKAFLFSCFSGLRMSDVKALTWGKIKDTPDGKTKFISIKMQKTKKYINLPLSQDALKCLEEKESDDVPIFKLPTKTQINVHITNWVKAAGIKKHITFHCARHTFATMMLTLGADIYTTSNMLGHSNVATTKIYAKIIDEKKVEAVGLMDNLFD